MQRPDHGDLVRRKDFWDWIPTLVAFLAIYAVLLVFYRPNLLFSMTTTTGGDTGAYHYPMQVLIQDLLPHFKLTGWAPGWYAGMPMFTFYFPFPFLLIAFFQWIIPYQIAFKIVTVLGVFALPVVTYAFARLLRIRRPYPRARGGTRSCVPLLAELLDLRRERPQHRWPASSATC